MVDPYELVDENYFEGSQERSSTGFDSELLREPLSVLPVQRAITMPPHANVTEAVRAMQREHRGCVLITADGTQNSKLGGIFTERDVLFRIVDKGRNPAALPLAEVMSPDPDGVSVHAPVAYVLNKMSVGGFRHIPVVNEEHQPRAVISVRDVVTFLVEAFPREIMNLPELNAAPSHQREGA